jgi:hypothetical protein
MYFLHVKHREQTKLINIRDYGLQLRCLLHICSISRQRDVIRAIPLDGISQYLINDIVLITHDYGVGEAKIKRNNAFQIPNLLNC